MTRLPNSVRNARAKDALKAWRDKIGRTKITISAAKAKGVPLPPGTPYFLSRNGFIVKVSLKNLKIDNSPWIYTTQNHWRITDKGIKFANELIRNAVQK